MLSGRTDQARHNGTSALHSMLCTPRNLGGCPHACLNPFREEGVAHVIASTNSPVAWHRVTHQSRLELVPSDASAPFQCKAGSVSDELREQTFQIGVRGTLRTLPLRQLSPCAQTRQSCIPRSSTRRFQARNRSCPRRKGIEVSVPVIRESRNIN